MFFDYMAVRLNAERAQGHDMQLNWTFTDRQQSFALTLRNGVLTYRENSSHAHPDAALSIDKATLDRISLKELDFPAALKQGLAKVEGDPRKLGELMGLLDAFTPDFNIATP